MKIGMIVFSIFVLLLFIVSSSFAFGMFIKPGSLGGMMPSGIVASVENITLGGENVILGGENVVL
jgi:hypothetical protein